MISYGPIRLPAVSDKRDGRDYTETRNEITPAKRRSDFRAARLLIGKALVVGLSGWINAA